MLCYNGEVFNYRVLQAELTRLGHRLRTDSDTEVVLEAFLEWGADAVTRLRGEFAFAIVDTRGGPGLPGPRPAWRQAAVLVPPGRRPARGVRDQGARTGPGAPVSEVPPGITAGPSRASRCPGRRPGRRYVDLLRLGDDQPAIEDPDEAANWSGPRWRTASGCGWTPT